MPCLRDRSPFVCACVREGAGADIQGPGQVTNTGALNLESVAP